MQGATLLGPGRIRTSGRGATHLGYVPIELAAPRDFSVGHRAYEISALFNSAGLKSQVTADIDGLVWGKVIINAAINPLTAILRVPNGALVESEETIGLMKAAALEAAAVAQAQRHHAAVSRSGRAREASGDDDGHQSLVDAARCAGPAPHRDRRHQW